MKCWPRIIIAQIIQLFILNEYRPHSHSWYVLLQERVSLIYIMVTLIGLYHQWHFLESSVMIL